jgi:hypothetical protein
MGIWGAFKKKDAPDAAKSVNHDNTKPNKYLELYEIIKSRRLRPLGNRNRLARCDEDTFDVDLLLFRDRPSLEKYYRTMLAYTRHTPPPFLLEMMMVHMPGSIFEEKYAVVMPCQQTDNRPAYCTWARDAVCAANETLLTHNSTDHKYKELHQYVAEVYGWDIVLPADFDFQSEEAKELLNDPPGGGFNMVNWIDPDAPPPGKPDPQGPWIGVLIEQKQFAEPLDGKTGTSLLIKRAGAQNFNGTIIHGANVEKPDPCWCVAIHADSGQQAELIAERIKEMYDKEYLSFFRPEVLREPVSELSGMPYLGYVDADGRYQEGGREITPALS